MNCKEVKEFIEIHNEEELQVYDEVKLHLEKCKECREYLENMKRVKYVLIDLKKSQYNQYKSLKKDNREFNNEIWTKIKKEKNKPKSLILIWLEVVVIIMLIGISIWNYSILSKEFIMTIAILFMTIGMGYTNYKEVDSNE